MDWDKDHVDLKWKSPTLDGGAPIEGYIVEVREKFSPQWKKALEVGPEETTATVGNLTQGEEYEFRIIAKVILLKWLIIYYRTKPAKESPLIRLTQ